MSGVNNLVLRIVTSLNFRQPRRFAGVKKKPNFSDQPGKYRPSVQIKSLRGFQFNDGDFVYKGDILVRQIGLDIYPGESVQLERETWNLIALCNGRFTISTDKLKPFLDSPLYETVKNGEDIFKPFVHVIGDVLEPIFKLRRVV